MINRARRRSRSRCRRQLIQTGLIVASVLASTNIVNAAEKLPRLGATSEQISVSGLSSGAYMAGQFQLAHADIVIGAAIIAGGSWGCADSPLSRATLYWPAAVPVNLNRALNGCTADRMKNLGVPAPVRQAKRARELARRNDIGRVQDVVRHRVYLFSGAGDRVVRRSNVAAAERFYEALGVPKTQIQFVKGPNAGHGFLTEAEGRACATTGKPFLNKCGYDQAGALLKHIYGPLRPRAPTANGRLLAFDQRPYLPRANGHGMGQTGLVYIPKHCERQAGCRVHIVFHGCRQNRGRIGDALARKAGFARWADTNRLILLFPQALGAPLTRQGCWDWYGYTGRAFLTKRAPQIVAVRAMIDRLAKRPN